MRLATAALILAIATNLGCEGLPITPGAGSAGADTGQLSVPQLADGVRATLRLSTERASENLGRSGGYADNPLYRITLPDELQSLRNTLQRVGLGGQLQTVEDLMNRGAEQAAVEARGLFLTAISAMTVDDALGIIRGGNTAATDYFRASTSEQLTARYREVMEAQLSQLDFYSTYQGLVSAYNKLPLANKPSLDLEGYAVAQGLTALFNQIGLEEQRIRANPLQEGGALLAKVLSAR